MNDPAVEAAERAMDTLVASCGDPGAMGPVLNDLSRDAAREALKPLRELHRRTDDGHCSEACINYHGNRQPWPCDTARLVYPESELA